ncbi:tetratricopeptide repeat protein [Roseimicrobium sp. ORNL1]|uniref:tetratricopeptide repeat protein n=1 Tax=Roseimicrobium sp. ORNL1 TaxID=2711231 RepID=UPI0013E202E8|nr:tetratricopeptide repeat protein [Roseimicrobium sp. ORNL1]QIF00541.1 tetratricopeptide repeat protein [Roseimicrobium sp. ORNL1]
MRLSVFCTLLIALLLSVRGELAAQSFREKALEAAKAGDSATAIDNYEKALNSTLKVFKEDHVEVITARLELGEAYRAAGRWTDAIGQLDYVWQRARFDAEQNKRWDGEEGHLAYAAGEKLGRSLQGAARYPEAATVFATAISDGEKGGREVTQLLTLDALLADTLLLLDRVQDAEKGLARARERIMSSQADRPEAQVRMLSTLVTLYHHHRQYALGLPVAQQVVDIANKNLEPYNELIGLAFSNHGAIALHVDGQLNEAINSLQAAEQIYVKKLGADARELTNIQVNLSQAEALKKNDKEAERHGLEALRLARLHSAPDSLDVALSLHNLANCYMTLKQPGKAGDLLENALSIMEKNLGHDHPQTVEARKMLEAAKKAASEGV